MANFADILSKPADSIEKPKPIPSGWYNLVVKSFKPEEIGQKKTPAIGVTFGFISPDEGVDEGELEAFGGFAKLRTRDHKHNFFATDDSLFRLKEFIENVCGISLSGRSLGQGLAEITNVTVKAQFGTRVNRDDPTQIFSEIKEFSAA